MIKTGDSLRRHVVVAASVSFLAAWLAGSAVYSFWEASNFDTEEARKDLVVARNLVEHGAFSLDTGPASSPRIPTTEREPLYPFWLAAVLTAAHGKVRAIIPAQALLHSLTTVFAFMLARSILPAPWAHLAMWLTALDPALAGLTGRPFAENLSSLIMTAAAVGFSRWLILPTPMTGLLAGVGFGLCALSRTQTLVLLPLAVFGFVIRHRRNLRGGTMAALAAFTAGCAIVIAPWSYRNYSQVGTPAIAATRVWRTMWERAAVASGPFSGRILLTFAVENYSTSLAASLFPGAPSAKVKPLDPVCENVPGESRPGEPRGLAVERIAKQKFLCYARKYPLRHLLYTLAAPLGFLAVEYEAVRYLRDPMEAAWGRTGLMLVNGALRWAGLGVFLLAVIGGVRFLRRREGGSAHLALWVAAYLGLHCVFSVMEGGRFALTIYPLLIIQATEGVRRVFGRRGRGTQIRGAD